MVLKRKPKNRTEKKKKFAIILWTYSKFDATCYEYNFNQQQQQNTKSMTYTFNQLQTENPTT